MSLYGKSYLDPGLPYGIAFIVEPFSHGTAQLVTWGPDRRSAVAAICIKWPSASVTGASAGHETPSMSKTGETKISHQQSISYLQAVYRLSTYATGYGQSMVRCCQPASKWRTAKAFASLRFTWTFPVVLKLLGGRTPAPKSLASAVHFCKGLPVKIHENAESMHHFSLGETADEWTPAGPLFDLMSSKTAVSTSGG